MTDLALPPIYLLPSHLSDDELRAWEAKIPSLTKIASEAKFIVGKISNRSRAEFELRRLKIATVEELSALNGQSSNPRVKRRKTHDEEDYGVLTDSPSPSDDENVMSDGEVARLGRQNAPSENNAIKVVRLAWVHDSLSAGKVLDYSDYLIHEAVKAPKNIRQESKKAMTPSSPEELMRRAQKMAGSSQTTVPRNFRHKNGAQHIKRPPLLPQSTTEEDVLSRLPPIPEYLRTTYSCERSTAVHPPNEAFIEKLKEVRELRKMNGDKIGVRAYSSAIASLSAYPYKLQSPIEVGRLPGCGDKIALLYADFEEAGQLPELKDADANGKMTVIKTFYNIWGVSAHTANEFYEKGWRDRDDVIEYGWASLTRSQQIGVKYYDEFLEKIPRAEVDSIANTVLEHANKIHDGFQLTVVGGYRRGKMMSGDVDLMLSHVEEEATRNLIVKLVTSLEDDKHITHTLTLSEANSKRDQQPTSMKVLGASAGAGFDTLDKALVVWQDPSFKPTAASPKNPNPHRRVDILISPWKTVGCAVLGWTSETTFQRDLRRYCKAKGLKFDSSGVRSRQPPYGWVDLEDGGRGKAKTMEEAERRVFEGLGLEWRPPQERCTG